ncbi:MAG: hypothetical protein MHMPM18_001369 [Marteilia pararefringens]
MIDRANRQATDPGSESQNASVAFVKQFSRSSGLAICTKSASAPLERLRSIIQSQIEISELIRERSSREATTSACPLSPKSLIRSIYDREGLKGFFRGNLANCMRYFPAQGLNFAINEALKSRVESGNTSDRPANLSGIREHLSRLTKLVLIGGTSGAISTIICYSLDFSRIQLANDISSFEGKSRLQVNNMSPKNYPPGRRFSGICDVYKKTVKTEGILGLNRGISAAIVKMFVYRGAYFGLYDFTKKIFSTDSPWILFTVAYGTTLCSGLIAYPLDTLNKRLMMTSKFGVIKFNGSINYLKTIVKNEGLLSLYRGSSIFLFRSLAGACMLAFNDLLKK